jgi:hypothetical protein
MEIHDTRDSKILQGFLEYSTCNMIVLKTLLEVTLVRLEGFLSNNVIREKRVIIQNIFEAMQKGYWPDGDLPVEPLDSAFLWKIIDGKLIDMLEIT